MACFYFCDSVLDLPAQLLAEAGLFTGASFGFWLFISDFGHPVCAGDPTKSRLALVEPAVNMFGGRHGITDDVWERQR